MAWWDRSGLSPSLQVSKSPSLLVSKSPSLQVSKSSSLLVSFFHSPTSMVDSMKTEATVWPVAGLATLAPIRRPRLCAVRVMSRMDHLGGQGQGQGVSQALHGEGDEQDGPPGGSGAGSGCEPGFAR